MEKTGSNMEEEGSGAERDCGQSGKQKKSKPKSKSREALERTQSQSFNVVKGAGKEGHIAAECQSEGQLSLFSVSTMTTRGNFGQNLAKPSDSYPRLYRMLLTSKFRRPIKETGRRSWWSRVWYCGIVESGNRTLSTFSIQDISASTQRSTMV